MVDLVNSMHIAGSGMKAQSERMKVIAQNIANADNTGETPGADPYRRKVLTFKNVLNKELDVDQVKVKKITTDKSDFRKVFNPGHPAADEQGYVTMPNVDPMLEAMDMKESQRSYEANLNVIEVSKNLLFSTIGLLR